MKTSVDSARGRRIDPAQRTQLLAAFERSGESAAAFARQHQLKYTTFCAWRQQWARTKAAAAPAFVQVEVAAPIAPAELVIELGAGVRLCLHSPSQLALAAQFIQTLHASRPC